MEVKLKRLIFVPQLPIHMRYQDWWMTEFQKKFKKYFDVITLGQNCITELFMTDSDSFSVVEKAIKFEQYQINEFLKLDIRNDDILFMSDISFPGFFSNILHHKIIENAFVFCHATSQNDWDYFRPVRESKWLVETGHSKLFKKVFVATNYHKDKLGWDNVEVVGVPKQPFKTYKSKIKKWDLISVARDNHQKRNNYLENIIEEKFGPIRRMKFFSWDNYYKYISESKIMIITSIEETFGYQILDAVSNGCVPLAPNNFSYPELLPRAYLYDNKEELFEKIEYYLKHPYDTPSQLLNQSMVDNFYDNIINYLTHNN